MSFGFSVGDFITVGRLVQHVISSLRASSVSEYQELILELHGLQRALDSIEHLKCAPSQDAALNGVKVAALMCQYPLDEFASKLKKFESMEIGKAGKASRADRINAWSKRLRWGFCMEEEVGRLRAYLMAHVGSLNMRLITQGLSTASFAAEQNRERHEALGSRLEHSHEAILETRRNVETHALITHGNTSILERLSSIVIRDVIPQLGILVDLASKVWQSNMQLMTIVAKLQSSGLSLNPRYTWVQEPVKFEDAMGRLIPIPSEYNWAKVEAIILDQFSSGYAGQKVGAGEYEIFQTLDTRQVVSRAENELLTPGMSITMAIIVGQYDVGRLDRCPRPGCQSDKIVRKKSGELACSVCQSCFNRSQKSLLLPLRPPKPDHLVATTDVRSQDVKRKRFGMYPTRKSDGASDYTKLRTERRGIKNLRLYSTLLGISPPVSNIRSKSKPSTQRNRPSYTLTDALSAPVDPALKYSRDKIRSAVALRSKSEPSIRHNLLNDSSAESMLRMFPKVSKAPSEPLFGPSDAARTIHAFLDPGRPQDPKLAAEDENEPKQATQNAALKEAPIRDTFSEPFTQTHSTPYWVAFPDDESIQAAATSPPNLNSEGRIFVPAPLTLSSVDPEEQTHIEGTNTREVLNLMDETVDYLAMDTLAICRLYQAYGPEADF